MEALIYLIENLVDLIVQKGNLMMMLKQFDKAIAAYSHAIELNPKYAKTYYNRGASYYENNSNRIGS